MSYIITSIIYGFNILNTFLRKESKIIVLLTIIFLWILMGANTQNPDIYAYQVSYYSGELDSLEIGYWLLETIFNNLGFTYQTFRMVICGVGILLMHNTINKITDKKSIFYMLYFIYPFFLDIVQIKNFLAMAIFIYSIRYLKDNNKYDALKYIVCILIASLIQITALIYLPIVFIINKRKTVIFKFLFIESVTIVMFVCVNNDLLSLISQIIIKIFGNVDDRIYIYMYKQTNWGFLFFWALQFMNCLLIYYCNKLHQKYESKYKELISRRKSYIGYEDKQKYLNIIMWINIFAFLFLPFYVFQATFSRFMRNIIPLNLICFSVIGEIVSYKDIRKIWFILLCFLYNVLIFYIEVVVLYNDSIIKAIFKFNQYLK